MNHHDIPDQHDADQTGEVHEPLLDAEDAKDYEGEHEELENHEGPRTQGEKLAGDVRRMARESAYAAAGFAGFVSEKAKEFYDEQREQYRQAHPDTDTEPGAKEFLAQMREKLHEFVEGLTKSVQDMADRGRPQQDTDGDRAAGEDGEDSPAAEAATFSDIPAESATGDVPPADAVVVEEVVPEGSEGDAQWPDSERTDGL